MDSSSDFFGKAVPVLLLTAVPFFTYYYTEVLGAGWYSLQSDLGMGGLWLESVVANYSLSGSKSETSNSEGNTYKYLIYTNIDDAKYIEQVYIKASDKSINTLIRILKFNGTDYILYSEPFKNNENIDWEKEFDLPKIMHLGKVL